MRNGLFHGEIDLDSDVIWCINCMKWITRESIENGKTPHRWLKNNILICDRIEITNLKTSNKRMPILKEREKTHGDYVLTSEHSQLFKQQLRNGKLRPSYINESLEMIVIKIARIISGDCRTKDHWQDIIGYAQLVLEQLEKQ